MRRVEWKFGDQRQSSLKGQADLQDKGDLEEIAQGDYDSKR